MHSWVFRNRRRLAGIYARRQAGSTRSARVSGGDSGQAAAEREGLRICVLFPRQGRILPAA